MRTSFFVILSFASAVLPGVASAAPESANSGLRGPGVDVIGQTDVAMVRSSRSDVALDVGLGVYWRLGPRLAFGVMGSRTFMSYGASTASFIADGRYGTADAATVFRGGGVVRYDYALVGPLAAWVAGEGGLAFAHDRYTANFPDGPSNTITDTRVAPWLGMSTGAELRPLRYLSIGVRVGALHAAFSAPSGGGSSVAGPLQSVYGGIDLGVHFPID
jgi:hypothetical protein